MKKNRRCIIVSGGERCCLEELKEAMREDDFLIACDKGYEYAVSAGLEPDLVLGDFDSCHVDIDESVNKITFPAEKDDTDTMLAMRYSVEKGFEEVHIYCALGGRLDHLLANIQTIIYGADHHLQVTVVGECDMIYGIKGDAERIGRLTIPRHPGWSISLFAATGQCRGVTTEGLKYRLEEGVLTASFPIGVSNSWSHEEATITVKEGILLVVLSKIV